MCIYNYKIIISGIQRLEQQVWTSSLVGIFTKHLFSNKKSRCRRKICANYFIDIRRHADFLKQVIILKIVNRLLSKCLQEVWSCSKFVCSKSQEVQKLKPEQQKISELLCFLNSPYFGNFKLRNLKWHFDREISKTDTNFGGNQSPLSNVQVHLMS